MSAKEIVVCAGWLEGNPEIGRCYIERARGVEVISFEYDRRWLSSHSSFYLGPDIDNIQGRQYPSTGNMFGFLSDSAPDRWGRTLMNRRERIEASHEHRPARRLMESDYVLGVHDEGRMGGLRFIDAETGRYCSDASTMAAPPIAKLREMQDSVAGFESEGEDSRWLGMLLAPGSSLGGARPKANVTDEYGHLWIAKFPSRNDDRDVGAWEMVENELARYCGINTSSIRLERFSDVGGTFLTSRFDRQLIDGTMRRMHMSSAMNEMNARDGESGEYSYLNLVEIIESKSSRIEEDLHQLWTRLAFNICTGNTDDHLRNHAFLIDKNDRFFLSPAYDMNPDADKAWMSLNIDFEDPTKDIRKAMDVAPYFRISESEAKTKIETMQKEIQRRLPYLEKKYLLPEAECKRMRGAFSESFRDISGNGTAQGIGKSTKPPVQENEVNYSAIE